MVKPIAGLADTLNKLAAYAEIAPPSASLGGTAPSGGKSQAGAESEDLKTGKKTER